MTRQRKSKATKSSASVKRRRASRKAGGAVERSSALREERLRAVRHAASKLTDVLRLLEWLSACLGEAEALADPLGALQRPLAEAREQHTRLRESLSAALGRKSITASSVETSLLQAIPACSGLSGCCERVVAAFARTARRCKRGVVEATTPTCIDAMRHGPAIVYLMCENTLLKLKLASRPS